MLFCTHLVSSPKLLSRSSGLEQPNGSWLTAVSRSLAGEGVSPRFTVLVSGAVDGLMVETGVGNARGLAKVRPAELSASAVVSRVVVDGVKSLTGADIDRCLSARSAASVFAI
jgi:hypothetical protein